MIFAHARLAGALRESWSSTSFAAPGLAHYAAPHIERETRRGVALLSGSALLFLLVATLFSASFGLGAAFVYTYGVLAALALHVRLSAARVAEVQALNLLAAVLLVVAGCSLVLLARQSGQLHLLLLISVASLLMLVPLVPWGLREALLCTVAIYAMFTSLTFFSALHFAAVDLWALQGLMLMASAMALVQVVRALALRKHDLAMRFGLEQAHDDMALLANRDHLTGAWNRRYLERSFADAIERQRRAGQASHFGLFDIDGFKQLNDRHGHAHGDCVLQAVAHAFGGLDGDGEFLARLGGDEFAFLIAGADADVVGRVAAMLAAIGPLVQAAAPAAALPTVSGGLLRLDGAAAATLAHAYSAADTLLYQVKRAGGNAMRTGGSRP